MVAFELVHYMKAKTKGRRGEVALKLEISKAYDRIALAWECLCNIIQDGIFSAMDQADDVVC
jgi:hypothetical protein